MKEIADILQKNKLIFKSLKEIPIKEFGSRKKINLYLGVDLKNYYTFVLHIKKKSKILRREAMELMEFHKKMEVYNESAIKKKYIYLQAPICSKAKNLFQEQKWTLLIK